MQLTCSSFQVYLARLQYLNPLTGHAINHFVLVQVESRYQTRLARCAAAYSSEVAGFHDVLVKVSKEGLFHVRGINRFYEEQTFLGRLTWQTS